MDYKVLRHDLHRNCAFWGRTNQGAIGSLQSVSERHIPRVSTYSREGLPLRSDIGPFPQAADTLRMKQTAPLKSKGAAPA
jgi:hypothetical protein